MNIHGVADQLERFKKKKKTQQRNLMNGAKFNPWSHDKNKSIAFSLRQKFKSVDNYNENK